MTPAARVAAAVELMTEIEAGGALDRRLAGYFRQRRFAGSKDRAAIAELVYAVERRRAELAWRLSGAGAEVRPRTLVLAGLILLQRLPLDEAARLFSGVGYGPPPLEPAERELLQALADGPLGPAPEWVQGGFPAWLEPELRAAFGADLVVEAAALQDRAPVDLRVNTLRSTREAALAGLAAAKIPAVATPFSPVGIRLLERPELGREPLVQSGVLEPQDEGSQLIALLTGAAPRQQVVDLCAGAGGKTLAIASMMRNRGQIYAFDTAADRLKALPARLQRAGVRNVQVHQLAAGAADPLLAELAGRMDRVLLDVPCSGTGTWRRNPDARWRLTRAALERHHERQAALLRQGAALVRPGGRLVYATCSLLPSENERPVEAFLAEHAEFQAIPVETAWAEAIGGESPFRGRFLALTPLRHGTDGFFAAMLQRSQ